LGGSVAAKFPAASIHKKHTQTLKGDGEKMLKRSSIFTVFVLGMVLTLVAGPASAQLGNSGSIEGVVKDPSGGVVAGATVEIAYGVSGFERKTSTGSDGSFRFTNVPFNTYHTVVTAAGFGPYTQDIDVRSSVPVTVQISLKVGSEASSITVEATGNDLVENDPSFHTDVDRGLFEKLPLESQSSSVSSLVTLATPGVVADSDGLFHGLGDHAENSFSVDGQQITDQQSKVFSNQIPVESIQSLEVISGAPPAEFGDKTSLIIKVTTRSGLGQTKPVGSVKASYGSFGSVAGGFDFAVGGQKWGNFIAASGLNTGRFLDPPEFHAIHDKGNEQNIFDRVDYQLSTADTIHVNAGYTRSWFQTPNSLDNLNFGVTDPLGNPVGAVDQRSLIKTYNVAPVWTRLISSTTLFTFGGFVRHDEYDYFPSGNVFADLPATVSQNRTLTNAGLRADVSYVKGINNVKAGVTLEHTFLREKFNFGITDPTFNAVCLNPSDASPFTGTTPTFQGDCAAQGLEPNDGTDTRATVRTFLPDLGCIDLSRPVLTAAAQAQDGCASTQSALFPFRGRTDIKELALYIQDTITKGNWAFNLGFRADIYRGIVHDTQPEPRVGIAYNVKKTNTVLRVSYARIQETPFNENLVLASIGSTIPVVNDVFNAGGTQPFAPIRPGFRNQFNAGFQQAFGKYFVVDADYMWKYTRNGYDFSVFGGTPITFPIAWHNSKLDGVSARVSVPNFHGLAAFAVFGHVNSRFFPPQIGGLGAVPSVGASVFRIDHDQAFNQTTHVQYQPWKNLPWAAFNWRYDSGLVVSGIPDAGAALSLTPNQQVTIGLACNGVFATVANPLSPTDPNCQTGPVTSKLITLPQGGFGNPPIPTQSNPDHNPDRVKPRNLLDLSVGDDNLFRGDRYKWSLRLTAINITNKTALYNFLSTFSGTHFVTPRAYTAELGFHF
jgi:hypothetical protein